MLKLKHQFVTKIVAKINCLCVVLFFYLCDIIIREKLTNALRALIKKLFLKTNTHRGE